MIFGKIVKDEEYYPAICNRCGWIGSSADCGVNFGDWGDSDVYCPLCGSSDTDGYDHERYQLSFIFTKPISHFRAWRMRIAEAKYWDDRCEEIRRQEEERL